MVSSIGNSPALAPQVNQQQVQADRQAEARRQQEDLEIRRQAEAEQQRIRTEENRAAADARAGRVIDVIA